MNNLPYDWNAEYRPYDQDDVYVYTPNVTTTHESTVETVPEQNPLPDGPLPDVSFDIEIGKHILYGWQVDFDYDAYFKLCDSLDMSREEASAVTISIGKKASNIPLILGYFRGDLNKIRIGSFASNTFLAHETTHARDSYRDKLSHPLRTAAANITALAIIPVTIGGLIYGAVSKDYDFSPWTGSEIVDRVYQATLASNFILYYLSPTEVRAHINMFTKRQNIIQWRDISEDTL